ncbi:hypothetical protein [Caulobacter phage Cr30]|uniref:hypothetical protein n=1 Tax=Caulobacter phage Cr30 TaxID=1357714 RepID=UPI0004A9BB7B|nr:hypothetical protein OZ74_gp032 [Caulobacter phage Cr30]AGS80917.1 hypothetical protein [Caulobacter phage Cr30]
MEDIAIILSFLKKMKDGNVTAYWNPECQIRGEEALDAFARLIGFTPEQLETVTSSFDNSGIH